MADTLPVDTTSQAVAELAPASTPDIAAAWTLANPKGTWVVAYPGARGHRHLVSRTRSKAFVTSSGSLAVFVKGRGGYILLTHVDPITAARAGELLEQDHQLLDLDADSAYTIPGACYGSYLNFGEAS